MAMLAEPRQRKRYNLVPKGKALYEDDSRFGTKMLEKMGWSKGKGLGAKEDGSLDFVRVKYKNDIQGLGFEQRDDQWTQHESSFNKFLSSLNEKEDLLPQEDNSETNDESPTTGFGFQNKSSKSEGVKIKEKISGVSLEEKSKQSKGRVHYKKFTRGKDLSQYSEKDLANIFGKKSINDQGQGCSSSIDIYDQLNKYIYNGADNSREARQVDTLSEKFSGVQTISTGLSINDYFKEKMAALKYRHQRTQEPVAEQESKQSLRKRSDVQNNEDIHADFQNKDVKRKYDNSIDVNVVHLDECEGDLEIKPTKRKKNKRL